MGQMTQPTASQQ